MPKDAGEAHEFHRMTWGDVNSVDLGELVSLAVAGEYHIMVLPPAAGGPAIITITRKGWEKALGFDVRDPDVVEDLLAALQEGDRESVLVALGGVQRQYNG